MHKQIFLSVVVISFLSFITINCGSDAVTNSNTTSSDGTLQVNRLAVAVVPTGKEMIIVNTIDETFSVDIEDPSIASYLIYSSDVEVTGIKYGKTTLTITSESGAVCKIPINVYNNINVDFGEIRLMYWQNFGAARGYGYHINDNEKFYFYHPEFLIGQLGWYAMGSLLLRPDDDPSIEMTTLIVKADTDADTINPPIMFPTSYEYDTYIDMGEYASRAAFFRANPPNGYSSLGLIAMFRNNNPPSQTEVACLRNDLVHFGQLEGNPETPVYLPPPFGDQILRSFDEIIPIDAPPHEKAYIPVGTFSMYKVGESSLDDSVINVLSVDLPLIAQSDEQKVIPQLNSIYSPSDQTVSTLLRVILTPYNTINDPDYHDRISWQIENSPFYRLEREVYYKLKYFNYNQTSIVQENKIEIVSGSVKSNSDMFWEETGINVKKESGITIGYKDIVSASTKYTTNVSRKLGYATMTNVQELREEHTTTTVYTPAGKAAAMWQKYNRITLKRHVGNEVEIVSVYEFGINEYITDEYPNSDTKVVNDNLSDIKNYNKY